MTVMNKLSLVTLVSIICLFFVESKIRFTNNVNIYSQRIRNNTGNAVMAHRGLFGYLPEHAQRGFELAYLMGADYLETDVVITKDGELVIFHDPHLDDATDVNDYPEFHNRRKDALIEGLSYHNKLFVSDFTYEELMKLRLKQRFAARPQFYNKEFKIVKLEELIEFVIKNNMFYNKTTGIYVEPKYVVYFQEELGVNLNSVLEDILAKYKLNDQNTQEFKLSPIVIQSFEYETLKYFKERANLPQIALMRWREFYSLSDLADVSDGYGVDVDFVLYERIDDKLVVNGTVYSSIEEFKLQVLPNRLKEAVDQLGNRIFASKENKLAGYITSIGRGLQVWDLNNDIPKFSNDPVIEYAKLTSVGVSAFFSDFCDTAIISIKHYQSLLARNFNF